jgi:hypothetical protein
MAVKADATLEDMAGYSFTIEKKAPSWVSLIVTVLFLLVGLLNSLSFFGIGNQGDPIIYFYSRIDDVSPNSYQVLVEKMPDELQTLNDRLEIYTVLHKRNYPGDFAIHYLAKLPFDLSLGIFFILFYYQQIFFSKNQHEKLKKITNFGLLFSSLLIFYALIYYLFLSKIYTEILQKYPFLTVKVSIFDLQLNFIAFVLAVFSTHWFFQFRKALYSQSISDVNSIEIKIL